MIGRIIGPYEIQEKVGEGGMGEVYRARDTKLHRDVALKILPAALAADADRLSRFRREAQLLASLNHPNVGQIYGFEDGDTHALVLELIPGPTLADRIARGPVALADALSIARQIADALEAAHESGVIHRDLKPSNIKVREDGTVKVLDFGLAKILDQAASVPPAGSHLANSPTTLSPAGTAVGMILGTAAYMSPEQARGKTVDKRADIWAFGVVLYEMLVGHAAFAAETSTDIIAAVVTRDPDWSKLPSDVPRPIRRLLLRCLDKDPRRRLRDIGDARPELELAPDDAIADSSAVLVPPSSVRSLGIVAGLVFAASIGGAAWWLKPASVVTEVVTRFDQPLPADRAFSHLNRHVLAISPDGTKMAYIANQQIYLRPMNQLDAQPIRGSNENPYELMFSPDGQWVAYFVAPPNPGVPGALKKLAIVGGAPVTLCPVKGVPYGGSWRGATIVFADYLAGQAGGIWAVGDSGGEPRPIVPIDDKKEFAAQPQLLADGVHVLMGVVAGSSPRQGEPDIVVQAIGQAGSRKVLVHGGSDPKLLSMGHLVYHQKGTLFGLAIDPTTFEIGGGPVPLVEGVRQGSSGAVQFAIAENGTLAYSPGGRDGPARRTLVWVDRQGHEEAVPAQPRAYVFPRLSPDGKQIAIESRDEQNDIWIWDLTRQALTRMTYGPDAEGYPVWMSDSRRVAYRLEDAKGTAIARSAADGTGTVERLYQASADAAPQSLAPDGGHLLFRGYDRQKTGRDLFLLPLDPIGPPAALVHSTFMEDNGEVSPDGRWIAYVSDESGKASEVFVRPFPLVGAGKWQASTNGGETPMWSRNGRELFFVTQVDGKDTLVGAAVSTTGSAFTYGRPAAVLPLGDYFVVSASRTFDISLDGRRFLLVKKVSEAAPPPASVTVVSHWFDDVRSRMKRN